MGLDLVELTMTVEETFGIKIDDRDAEQLVSVGGVYQYILERVDVRESAPCATAAAFYRFRRALVETQGVARERIVPDARLAELVPADGRRANWREMEAALGLSLPGLDYPLGVAVALMGLGCVLLVVSFVLALIVGPFDLWLVAGLLGQMAFLMAGFRLAEPLRTGFPLERDTVRSMVLTMTHRNLGRIQSMRGGMTRQQVWDALVSVVAEQAGVDPATLTEETRFVDDLGLD